MKSRSTQKVTEKSPENPRLAALKRIMNIAQLVRQRGEPEAAMEALEWEKRLSDRIKELEGQNPQNALAA